MPLTNRQYNRIQMEYDQIRFRNKHVLDERVSRVYQNVPEIKRIDDQIVSLSIGRAKQAILNKGRSPSPPNDEIATLSKERVKQLTANGYPANYLDPIYTCVDCEDTGYVGDAPCHCMKRAMLDSLYEQSTIRHLLERDNFSNFSQSLYPECGSDPATGLTPRENIKKVVKLCHEFIGKFDSNYANLFIYGNTGVGKTFLTHCVAKELLDRHKTVIYLSSLQFIEILEKTQFRRETAIVEYDEILSHFLDCDLLVLDDLGTELVNSFTASCLFHYIEGRHVRRKATILSTNLSLEELAAQYSERVFSRITSYYHVIKLFGNDLRLAK